MARQSKQPLWAGVGISMGAGLGTIVGLLGWGGSGIALGAVFGACVGLVVGAMVDSLRATSSPASGTETPRSSQR